MHFTLLPAIPGQSCPLQTLGDRPNFVGFNVVHFFSCPDRHGAEQERNEANCGVAKPVPPPLRFRNEAEEGDRNGKHP